MTRKTKKITHSSSTIATRHEQQLSRAQIWWHDFIDFLNQHPILGFVIVVGIALTLAYLLAPAAPFLNQRRVSQSTDSQDTPSDLDIHDMPDQNPIDPNHILLLGATELTHTLQQDSNSAPTHLPVDIDEPSGTTSIQSRAGANIAKTSGTLFVVPDSGHTNRKAAKSALTLLAERCNECVLIIEGEWARLESTTGITGPEIYAHFRRPDHYKKAAPGKDCYFIVRSETPGAVLENLNPLVSDCRYVLSVEINFDTIVGTLSFASRGKVFDKAMKNFLHNANQYLKLAKEVEMACRKKTGKETCLLSDTKITHIQHEFAQDNVLTANKIYDVITDQLYKYISSIIPNLTDIDIDYANIISRTNFLNQKTYDSLQEVLSVVRNQGDKEAILAIESQLPFKKGVDYFLYVGIGHLYENAGLVKTLKDLASQVNVKLLDPNSGTSTLFKPLRMPKTPEDMGLDKAMRGPST